MSDKNKTKIAIYPGTFDPITMGHVDVIERASQLFDKVIVAVSENVSKTSLFSIEERLELVKTSVKQFKNVTADRFYGLLVDYARIKKAKVLIRGLRAISDFEYEFQMALTNRKMKEEITTVFLMPNEKYTYISSTLVKEVAQYGGSVDEFVPKNVALKLKKKFKA